MHTPENLAISRSLWGFQGFSGRVGAGMCVRPFDPSRQPIQKFGSVFLKLSPRPDEFCEKSGIGTKKNNPTIIRLDFGSSDSRKKREKVDFQSRLWTLNLKNFPNRGAKGRRRGSGNFQIETAHWGSRRSQSGARRQP